MLRRRPAGQGNDNKGSGGDGSGGGKGDGKEHVHFDCKKCGTANEVAVDGSIKPRQTRKRRMCGNCLAIAIAFFAIIGASDYVKRAELPETVQDVLKTKYNITLPEIETPDFLQNLTIFGSGGNDTARRGIMARQRGLRPKHPIVIIPGFVTTGLELWAALPCGAKHFRQRLWGTLNMPQAILSNARCWVEHMQLNQSTGLDPEGVMLRASEGLAAVDFLMPSYYVWAKIIEALADLGYDPNMLVGETYDWRLSVANMERRDSYFSRLKARIELLHSTQGEKVMVAAHSWGENVFRNFLGWVERLDKGWTEKHLGAYVNIAGCVLGVPKALTALLSGEMRDTAELGTLTKHATENYLPRPSRAHMFRSWGSLIGMLPQGGNRVWGNSTWAPDDNDAMREAGATYGSFFTALDVDGSQDSVSWVEMFNRLIERVSFRNNDRTTKHTDGTDPESTAPTKEDWKHLSVNEAMALLLQEGAFRTSPDLQDHIGMWGAPIGIDGERFVRYSQWTFCTGYDPDADVTFQDPMVDPLPYAPSLKMFCVYGVNKPVERSYLYLHLTDEEEVKATNRDEEASREVGVPLQWSIATEISNSTTFVDAGVRKGNGDGTVPLISLGLHCRKGWRTKALNPAGFPVVTHELKHDAVPMYQDPRGGGKSGDHVDVLGNYGLLDILLSVAAGRYEEVEEKVVSNIDEIADKVSFPP